MKVAIGSSSSVEIEAVREACTVFSESLLEDKKESVEFLKYGVGSPVSRPLQKAAELMTAARDRVENLILQLKRERTEADFYTALENGFMVVDLGGARRQVFLETFAYVSDGHRGSFGHGGGIPVPGRVADQVLERGIDMAIVMERFTQGQEVREEGGAWGVFTRDILSARHSHFMAVISAFAPFYNSRVYS